MTRGEYQHKPPLPFIPGLELSGEIEALGEGVERWKLGDAVVGGARIGGFSDYASPTRSGFAPSPSGCRSLEAAAYGAAYLTAYVSLVRRAADRAGRVGAGARRGRRRRPRRRRPGKLLGAEGDRRLGLRRQAGRGRSRSMRRTPP